MPASLLALGPRGHDWRSQRAATTQLSQAFWSSFTSQNQVLLRLRKEEFFTAGRKGRVHPGINTFLEHRYNVSLKEQAREGECGTR